MLLSPVYWVSGTQKNEHNATQLGQSKYVAQVTQKPSSGDGFRKHSRNLTLMHERRNQEE